MRWTIGVPTLLTLLALLVAVALPALVQAAPTMAADRNAELESAIWAYEEAFEVGDLARLVTFFDEDAYAVPPGAMPLMGREAIEAYMAGMLENKALDREFKLISYKVSGDYATRLGEWTNTFLPVEGGDPQIEVGHCMFGYEFDGEEWKVVWQIWNNTNDLPPAIFRDGSPC